jgi:hypothetical protein
MSFEECELAVARMAADKAEQLIGRKIADSPETTKIFSILTDFLQKNQLIIYGGTAINNILPEKDQFYNRDYELPDYDIFSIDPLDDITRLSDIYAKEGFSEVDAKAGVHVHTYKLYINFIPVADFTYLHKEVFFALKKDSILKNGIYYASPNFLRLSIYLELSRPEGDVTRWEKIIKRLNLLNKHYPLKAKNCDKIDFQRNMDNTKNNDVIFDITKNVFIDEGCVFFGGYALSMYASYMPRDVRSKLSKKPDFDVLSLEPLLVAKRLKRELEEAGIRDVSITRKNKIGEIISEHYYIKVKRDFIAFIYKPLGCHSYNEIRSGNKTIKIASIDTILTFYLAFLYSSRIYYECERILCVSEFLYKVQQVNRLNQKGLLRRFSLKCYGHQESLKEIRENKMKKYMELKNKPNSEEYNEYFFRYRPTSGRSSGTQRKMIKTSKNTRRASNRNGKNSETRRNKQRDKRGLGGIFGFDK